MVLRDDVGEFVACKTIIFTGLYEIDEGKTMGLFEALSWILHLGSIKSLLTLMLNLFWTLLDPMNAMLPCLATLFSDVNLYFSRILTSILIWYVEMSMLWHIV
ncbi:hypothetical protein ACS0TY_029178 [Phlomoides rotata]